MDTKLDPLRNSELHRALAFARARETYPGIGGELLLELCDAAWERAAGDTRDGGSLERFERALDVVARSYRVGGGRLSVSEVADDAIPLAALQPYIDAQKRRPAPVEPDPAAAPARRSLTDKLPSLPRIAPAPVGVSLAAGVFGITAAAQAGALEQTPLAPLSFTDGGDAPAPAPAAGGTGDRAVRAGGGTSTAGEDGPQGPASPLIGELAAGNAATAEDVPEDAPAPRPEPTGAVQAPSAPAEPSVPTGPAPVAATPEVPTAPAEPEAPPPVTQKPAVEVEVGDDEEKPAGEHESHEPPVGVHYPTIQLPGGVVVEIPQEGDEGEEVPPENVLTPEEETGEEDAPENQLPGEEVGGEVPEDELPPEPLPPEEQPDGVAEEPVAPAPAPAPAPEAPAPATPPAPPAPAAAPPAPTPAPPAPAAPQA